jgi:1,4-alpha-glucan branching enzyme
MKQPPVLVAMYDAELFGHWWFEGPLWLEHLFRKFHGCRDLVQLTTPSKALSLVPKVQEVVPHLSTWGWKGYNEVWLQGANAWVYRHLHRAAWRMGELVGSHGDSSGITRRALNQALRELLLAQASDWTFILGQGTASDYARTRLTQHLIRFTSLYEQLQRNAIDENWLGNVEGQDNLFPFLDYRIYR